MNEYKIAAKKRKATILAKYKDGFSEIGKRAGATNKKRYGDDYYKKLGALGGKVRHPETSPFTRDSELAIEAGRRGGLKSRRSEDD